MTNIKWVIVPALFFCWKSVHAQDDEITDVRNVSKITVLNPGLSYEMRIGKHQTLYGQACMNVSAYYFYSSSLGTNSGINLDPAATLQYRYYYNSVKRYKKSKRIDMNSMNFLSIFFETLFIKQKYEYYEPVNKFRPYNTLGLAWGIQRNYKNRFSLDFLIGYGYNLYNQSYYDPAVPSKIHKQDYSGTTIFAKINIGFWLNRRN